MKKFAVGSTAYVVGKPGIEFGAEVKVLNTLPGTGYLVGVGTVALLVEPKYLSAKVWDVAA